MLYSIEFSIDAEKSLAKFKKSNSQAFKKVGKILCELAEHPRIGTGHPEQLKQYEGDVWSRHITKRDRIIYEINDTAITVLVIDLEGHYDDH